MKEPLVVQRWQQDGKQTAATLLPWQQKGLAVWGSDARLQA
jgi:hypothetical protein